MKKTGRFFIAALMSLVMAVTFIPCFSFAAASDEDNAAAAEAQVMDKVEEAEEAGLAVDLDSVGKSADVDDAIVMYEGENATGTIKLNKVFPSLSKYASFMFSPDEEGVYTFRNVITDEIAGEEFTAYLMDEDGNVMIYADCYSNPDGLGFFFQTYLYEDEIYFMVVTADYNTDVTVVANSITEEEAAIPAMQSVVYDDGNGECHSIYEFMEYRYTDEETGADVLGYYAADENSIVVPYGAKEPTLTYFDALGDKVTQTIDNEETIMSENIESVDDKVSHEYKINILHETETSMFVYADVYKTSSLADVVEYMPVDFDTTFSGKSTVTVKIPKKYWKKKYALYAYIPYEGTSALITNSTTGKYFYKSFKPYKKSKITLKVQTPNGTVRSITFKFKKK